MYSRHPDEIQEIVEYSGLAPDWSISQKDNWLNARRRVYRGRVSSLVPNLSNDERDRFIRNVAKRLIKIEPSLIDELNEVLRGIGWSFIDNNLVLNDQMNIHDIQNLPQDTITDLSKAVERLPDDMSGAITAACGAVDSVCKKLYNLNPELGDINKAGSFQSKINKVFGTLNISEKMKEALINLGWREIKADELSKHLKNAISQYAKVLEILRSNMGDTHGTEKVLPRLAFSSIKWSMTISSLLIQDG